ncbi:MAG TPA: hypothetical protein VEG25_07110 [Burkholderiales bacterium]|nr:hypothetical protein [Burkholderiales bacterium]
MFRNKLSALALGILLSTLSLGTALAADEAKMAGNYQQDAGVPCADSKQRGNDKTDKGDWYEQQLRVEHG